MIRITYIITIYMVTLKLYTSILLLTIITVGPTTIILIIGKNILMHIKYIEMECGFGINLI